MKRENFFTLFWENFSIKFDFSMKKHQKLDKMTKQTKKKHRY